MEEKDKQIEKFIYVNKTPKTIFDKIKALLLLLAL
jgi:hypothetical protein